MRIGLVLAIFSLFIAIQWPIAHASTTSSDVLAWPKAEIPYIFDDGIPKPIIATVRKAMDRINQLKLVKFVPTQAFEGDSSGVLFTYKKNGPCSSGYGYRGETNERIRVSEACTYGNILHELLHSLGMVHEQLNPRRPFPIHLERAGTANQDQYVNPNAVAITDHDPHSIMHYQSLDNSICYIKIDPKWKSVPKGLLPRAACSFATYKELQAHADCWKECAVFWDPVVGAIGGERVDLSPLDIAGLRKLYAHLAP